MVNEERISMYEAAVFMCGVMRSLLYYPSKCVWFIFKMISVLMIDVNVQKV